MSITKKTTKVKIKSKLTGTLEERRVQVNKRIHEYYPNLDLSPAIRQIRLPFDDDMILDLIVKYTTQVWGLQARLETKNNYRYVRATWPLELNMLNLDKVK